MSAGYQVRLRLHSGVPVVDVVGEWNATVTDALIEMIGALAGAGHYEIIVNIRRAAREGISALETLSRMTQAVRSHCGHIEVVATMAQIEELLRQQIEGLFHLAASEESAISRIKRVPVMVSGTRLTARPRQLCGSTSYIPNRIGRD